MECESVICEIKKFWLKSKVVILNLITTLFSFFCFLLFEAKDIIEQNLEWLKISDIEKKYLFLIFAILALINVFLRFKTNEAITMKKNKESKDKTDSVS